jgi:hypothetical protein
VLHGASLWRWTMHIKHRPGRAMLYRSLWVRKGAEGNTHGFSRQTYVGSLALAAVEFPAELAQRLSPEEKAFVEQNVLQPARRTAEAERAEKERHARDPLWRLEEAIRLVRDASALSNAARVPASRVKAVHELLNTVRVIGQVSKQAEGDPMDDAIAAVRRAANAVGEGHYGAAPAEGVRKRPIYARWLELTAEMDGSAPAGLLRQLQKTGWVKAKGSS